MIARRVLPWVVVAAPAALIGSNGVTAWMLNAAAYDRDVRDQKILNLGATGVLNAAQRETQGGVAGDMAADPTSARARFSPGLAMHRNQHNAG